MANSDKNIKITPNISQTAQPNVVFTGQGNVPITLKVLDDSFGTLSFEGSAGQLFSVNNNLSTGVIFSVNDISGIPQIDVNADGTIRLAPFGGAVQLAGMNIGLGLGSIFTNTAFGSSALAANTTGSQNTAIGYFALKVNTTALANTAVGYLALSSAVSSASYNAAFGANSLQNASSGNSNAAFGCNSLAAVTTGSANTGLGQGAGQNYTTGSNNVSIGYEGGRFQADGSTLLTTPANSIYIGVFSRGLNNSDSNSIVIGYQAIGKGANTTVLGNTSTTQTWLGGGELRLPGSTSGYVGLRGAATAGSVTYTLPAADGTAGQTLSTNGSGTLSWASGGGSGTVTSVSGTGTVNGITLTGTVTSSGSLTLGGSLSGVNLASQVTGTLPIANGGTGATTALTANANIVDWGQLINHSTITDFNNVQRWGCAFVTGTTNGPGVNSASQYYQMMYSLGADYSWEDGSIYAMQMAIPRNVISPYVSVRYKEGGAATAGWGSWQKISAGYADTSGSVNGTVSYVPKFTSTNVVGNSLIYDSGTNIGIGTTSPSGRIHISTTGTAEAKLEGTTAAYLSFIRSGVNFGYVGLGSAGNSDIYIYNLNSGAVRINNQAVYVTATNLVGINETSPGAQLQVTSAAAATKGLIVKAAANPTANLLEVQNSSGTNLVYVDSTGDLAVGVPNATYFPSGPGAPLHVTRPTTAVATAIAAWPTYEPDTQTHARVTAFFTDGGNGGTATVATGTTNIIKFGEYYTARVVLMPEGAGGQTPADQNSGSGRDIMLLGGKSDNAAGKTGGRVFIQGGTGFAGAYGSNFGDVILQANGGRVCVGGTSPVSTSPGLDITADASNSATGQLMIKRASTNDRFRLTCGVHTSNYAFIKAYENGIGAINLALQPDVGSVGIGTTSPSDKLHVIGNVRAGNYTYGYLAMTGDLPGYANGSYPTLKSDNTIYFSADGKYSAYLGDASKNVFGLLHPTAGTANVLLNPNGTSYFTGGSVAFGATTAAGGGQVYVAPTSNATKGLVVRGAASQSANLQEWQNNGGTALATVSSAGSAYFPDISSTISSLGSGKRSRSFSRVLPSTVGNYVEITTMGEYGNPSYEINAVTNHGSGENEVNKRYFFIVTFGGVSGTLTPIAQYGGGHDFELEAFRESAGTTVLRLRRTSNTYGTNITAQITVTEYSPPGNGLPDRTGTGTSPYGGYNSSASLLPRLLPSMMALDPVGRTGAGTAVNLYAGNAFVTGAGGAFGIYGGNATGTGAGGSIILQPGAQATSGGNGVVVVRQPGGTAGTDELQISHDGTNGFIETKDGNLTLRSAAGVLRLQNPAGTSTLTITTTDTTGGGIPVFGGCYQIGFNPSQSIRSYPEHVFGANARVSALDTGFILANSSTLTFGPGPYTNTARDCGLGRQSVGVITVTNASTGGGSFAFTSSSPSGYTGDQTDLVLNGSAFQRLSGTAARNIFSIAPPSGGSHVDGRMIRIYNVGSFNLTLKHNYTTGTTQANRMFCVQSVDIIIAPNDYAELIYDGTNNGSGAAGWRAA